MEQLNPNRGKRGLKNGLHQVRRQPGHLKLVAVGSPVGEEGVPPSEVRPVAAGAARQAAPPLRGRATWSALRALAGVVQLGGDALEEGDS